MTDVAPLPHFTLTPGELTQVRSVVSTLAETTTASTTPYELIRAASTARRLLPERLAAFVESFRREEPAGGFRLTGWQVDDDHLGPTPGHWRRPDGATAPARGHELYLLTMASLLGDIFSWSTLQDGHLVQDLLPVRGEERDKSAGSSASELDLHNEDAFSAVRCDYLGLLCLRNDDRVPTTVAEHRPDQLTPAQLSTLSQPRYLLMPDEEHIRRAEERGEEPLGPRRTALLFGGESAPYLAFVDYFTATDPGDEEAARALHALASSLDHNRNDATLDPGEILFIDKYHAVHGRRPFQARYDGRDRWLKRISVTRDLRKSRAVRHGTLSPVVVPGLEA
ncbi:guanitoxin biosynthesis L-enduracididine beta-hydroxylase GntD [Streptomyces sp. NPDC048290]|uniref:guanitoxin biosynthesis L-enduracididine beta-hydroxylase GntD n=1 Tax=Streptomyces sp. NPDC048290 TaxID=3155811 RepID=UPI00341B1C9C